MAEAGCWLASEFVGHDWDVAHCLLQGVSICGQWEKKMPSLRIKETEIFIAQPEHLWMLWDLSDSRGKNRNKIRDAPL